jgi:hypothetical protein
MHTIMMILGGLVLLGVFLLIGRMIAVARPGTTRRAALWFLPAWLIVALVNLWIGVTEAGYSVADEFPFLLAVFGIPALAALGAWWRLRPAKAPAAPE